MPATAPAKKQADSRLAEGFQQGMVLELAAHLGPDVFAVEPLLQVDGQTSETAVDFEE
jgi:hypothetical protein